MYFHKPQEKPRRWGSFQDVQYAIRVNSEKIYGCDPDDNILVMPGFWGLSLLDYSGKNNHGTNHGATYKDGSLNFDGVNDYVDIPDDILGLTQWTVSQWVKTPSSFSGNPNQRFSFGSFYYPDSRSYIGHDASGSLYARVGNSAVFGSLQLTVNTYYHFTLAFSNGNSAEIFVDAVSRGSASSITYAGSTGLNIGSYYEGVDSHWQGPIDEVHISKATRTTDQIALFHDLPWALYQPVSRPIYFFQAAAGGVAPTSTIYGPLYGPFAGPI